MMSKMNLLSPYVSEKVWGYEYFGDVRTVDVTVRRIREKIETFLASFLIKGEISHFLSFSTCQTEIMWYSICSDMQKSEN